ncbi:MAG: hypothetical protein AAF196_09570 [Planctomycetota bacterium]
MASSEWRSLGVAVALLFVATAVRAQDPGRAEEPDFSAILWLRRGDPSPETCARIRELGFDAVSIGRSQNASALSDHRLRFYGDQVAGKGVLELREAQWSAWRDAFLRSRSRGALARPSDLADPVVLERLRDATRDGVSRLLGGPAPLFVSLGDEASATRRGNPMDPVAGPAFEAAFREFVRGHCGGSIARLNERWGVQLGSFEELRAPTTDELRDRAFATTAMPRTFAAFHDVLAFQDQLFADATKAGLAVVRDLRSDLRCGLTGMQPPVAFGGHDYRLLMPDQTAYEAYDLGGARDLSLCFQAAGARFFQTIFPPPVDGPVRLPQAAWSSALAHGASGVIVWSSQEALQDERYASVLSSTDRRLEAAARHFGGARLLRDRLWIVESRPSTFAWWMLDSDVDGDTWTNRLTSYETEHGTSVRARVSWIQLCNDLGFQPRHVDSRDLVAGLQSRPPRAVVLPATLVLGDAEARALVRFVEAGGTLIADHSPGLYDQDLRRRSRGVFDEFFGLKDRSSRRSKLLIRNGAGASDHRVGSELGLAESSLSVDRPGRSLVPTNHMVERGRGRAVYLNLAVCEYAAARRPMLGGDEAPAVRELRRVVGQHLESAGLRRSIDASLRSGEGPLECMHLRGRDGRLLLAVRLDRSAEAWEARRRQEGSVVDDEVTLRFRSARSFRDLLTGKSYENVEEISLPFDPFVGVFLAFD